MQDGMDPREETESAAVTDPGEANGTSNDHREPREVNETVTDSGKEGDDPDEAVQREAGYN